MTVLQKRFSRRKFFGGLGAFGVTTLSYANIESDWLDVGRYELAVGKGKVRAPLKILHLSDLHASHFVSFEFIQHAIELGLKQKPDIVCLTGDYVTRKCSQMDRYAEVLSLLPKAAPTYATLGNHDGGWYTRGRVHGYDTTSDIKSLLERSNIELLDNHSTKLKVRDWNLNMVGVGDFWARDFEPAKAYKNHGSQDDTTVMLSHNPDTKDALQKYPWDVMLSGHTHGGQVTIPLLGTPIAPVKDRRFIKGLHRWDNRWVYVTRGVGNLYGIRVNCRPEVSLLTLV
ncbi:MAG: metallophosphoesterase [Verrucomicrobiales bacterium]|nr:metallophosphoesterase [Verrucomicrobiales bacterium]